ncbi:MAG: ABC transporter substrate-binding protein, partial [Bacteroidota bacterium]
SIPYALQWGRGIEKTLGERFVKMYVSDITVDMGEKGKSALEVLFKKGHEKGLIAQAPRLDLV